MEDNAPAVGRRAGIFQTREARKDAKGREFSAFSTRMEERRLETSRLTGEGEEDRSERKRDFNKDMETRRLNGELAAEGDRQRKEERERTEVTKGHN